MNSCFRITDSKQDCDKIRSRWDPPGGASRFFTAFFPYRPPSVTSARYQDAMTFRTRILFQEDSALALFEVRFLRVDMDEVEAALREAVDGLGTRTTPFHLIRSDDHVVGLVRLAQWGHRHGQPMSAEELRTELDGRLKRYFETRQPDNPLALRDPRTSPARSGHVTEAF